MSKPIVIGSPAHIKLLSLSGWSVCDYKERFPVFLDSWLNFGVSIDQRMGVPPLLNVADYALVARGKLPKDCFDYYEGGALDEITLRENSSGWERLKLYYRVLAGVGVRDLNTTVLGQSISMPIAIAPTAFHRLACDNGEIATARAAKAAGTLFILSSLSNTAMESVFAEAVSPRWFQLYMYKDRMITLDLVKRAEAAGAQAIVLTVDAPGLGTRERDTRNNFQLPDGLTVENLAPLGKGKFPEVRGSGLAAYVRENFKQDLGFDDLAWLCHSTRLPVVVKGLCRGDDACRTVEHGVRRWSSPITVGDNWIPHPLHAKSYRTSSMRWGIVAKFTSMGEFDAAAMCSRRLHSVRAPCWWVAQCFGDCASPANKAPQMF